ncbi:MAG TPA: Asp-tRNA(Asn)/Glu-tRNA(Gln) amidotransferase GatCAB subunit B, partial [Candidatus Paceibacterota bacterium]|nr:Asp-tRNA(Asn)/Glu-tRNA(Gln) amidotransferase GatCAB subunit B [Candidatus Paceibacterota bacterium]
RELGNWFEEVASKLKDKEKVRIASNYITSDFLGLKKTNLDIKLPKTSNFVELIEMISLNQISSRSAKDILAMIVVEDNSPMEIAKAKDLLQKNDEGQLKEVILKIIKDNPKVVETYKSGKENAIMSLVGQVMKETSGSANPQLALKLLKELI